ncbi:GNAT family N-acetyltransferase [Marinomonas algicola]|uniref:GNAT family N-acetyltransferase n=1 Tax=Marinomonas algicola TaxID=2773454 RepID=UPI0017487E15|nr:GNAT family N-acetyltransferase [Marinomonas algicola]
MLKHSPEQQLFQFEQDNDMAILKYKLIVDNDLGPSYVDFYSTFVPETLRSQGIAERLVRAGLKWANDNNFQITASCWYVKKFLRKK